MLRQNSKRTAFQDAFRGVFRNACDAGVLKRRVTVMLMVPMCAEIDVESQGPAAAAEAALNVVKHQEFRAFPRWHHAGPPAVAAICTLGNPSVPESVPERVSIRAIWGACRCFGGVL